MKPTLQQVLRHEAKNHEKPGHAGLALMMNNAAEEIDGLRGQIEQLREAMQGLMDFHVKHLDIWNNQPYDLCVKALAETPAQCLAEHNVKIVVAAYKDYRREYIGQGISAWFGGYINKLRQQSRETK